MKELGKTYYEHYAYFNFDEEEEVKSIFEVNKNCHRIFEFLAMLVGKDSSMRDAEHTEVFQRKSKRLSCHCQPST